MEQAAHLGEIDPPTVVVIEDSVEIRRYLIALLEDMGLAVVGQADSPGNGIRAVRSCEPDLLVLDLNLVGGSGFEVLEEIGKLEAPPVTAVLTVSAYPQYKARCEQLGAEYFFDKGTELEEFMQLVRSFAPLKDGSRQ